MVSSGVTPAPEPLEFVRRFVNTLDIEAGTDDLNGPEALRRWAAELGVPCRPTSADVGFARLLREALREALIANHDRSPMPRVTIEALDAASDRAAIAVRFEPDGAVMHVGASGIDAVFGKIVVTVATSSADGTWSRLKACAADDCRWGFYDSSRSRSAQWCSMGICGNRAKQARWRGNAASRPPAEL